VVHGRRERSTDPAPLKVKEVTVADRRYVVCVNDEEVTTDRQRREAIVADQEVLLGRMTRREFREALERGWFRTAIVATGSIEQHLEHLAMDYDISAASWVAEQAARRLYPQVVVAVPVSVGISEHHMLHPGTLTAKPGSWLAVVFDAVESLVRHGVRNVLILNGHGGNEAPVEGILRQWQIYFHLQHPEASVEFHS
jgi:hypothetical protein